MQEPTRRHSLTPEQQTKFLEVRQKLIERFAVSCDNLMNHWEPSPEETLRVLSLLFPGQSVPPELLVSVRSGFERVGEQPIDCVVLGTWQPSSGEIMRFLVGAQAAH
jgi:hypothetical protein